MDGMQSPPRRIESTRATPIDTAVAVPSDTPALMDIAAYITVALGYIVAVLMAANGRLNVAGFAALTLGNLLWLGIYRRVTTDACTGPRRLRYVLALILLTALVEITPPLGVGYDWLLPLVTVGIIGSMYPLRRALALSLGVVVITLATMVGLQYSDPTAYLQEVTSIVPAFVFVFAFSVVARQQMELRERAELLVTQLEAAQTQLREYTAQVEELSATRERNRIAREIHDTLGHYLTILAVQLETALKLESHGDARLHGELVEARRVASECLTEVRRSVSTLRPTDPTTLSFDAALARIAAEFEAVAPQTAVVLDAEGPTRDLTPELRVAFYRCVQESLTNIRKHANATKVLVRMRVDTQAATLLILDDGEGNVAHGGHEPGFGLLGIRERIALLGGTAQAGPDGPDGARGWRVEVRVPLAPSARLISA